jgi:hypothetical protein
MIYERHLLKSGFISESYLLQSYNTRSSILTNNDYMESSNVSTTLPGEQKMKLLGDKNKVKADHRLERMHQEASIMNDSFIPFAN